jgi:hypothetical protein
VLLFGVIGATVAVGAERTVLNAEFVSDGLEDEGLYEEMAPQMAEGIAPEGAGTAIGNAFPGEGPDPRAMAERVVTPAWLQGEAERNLRSFYAYIHGDADELSLGLDTGAVKSGFAEEFETWILETDAADLNARMGQLTRSQDSFRETRTDFREDQYDRIQAETEAELSRSELEARFDDQRDSIRSGLVSELEDSTGESGAPPPIQAASVDYGTVAVAGLVDESMDYETLVDEEETAREDLATAVGEAVRTRLDEGVPDRMDLTADVDQGARDAIETARTGVTLLGLLAIGLPLVALGAAGAIGYVSRRRSNGLWRVGGVVAVAGLLVAIVAWVTRSMVPDLLETAGETPAAAEAGLSVATGALVTVAVQSLAVLAAGVLLVGTGIGVRRQLVPIADDPTPTPDGTPAETDDPTPADEQPVTDGSTATDDTE